MKDSAVRVCQALFRSSCENVSFACRRRSRSMHLSVVLSLLFLRSAGGFSQLEFKSNHGVVGSTSANSYREGLGPLRLRTRLMAPAPAHATIRLSIKTKTPSGVWPDRQASSSNGSRNDRSPLRSADCAI